MAAVFFCIGQHRRDLINYDCVDKHFTIKEMVARVPKINEFADVRHEQFLNVHGAEVSPERGWTGAPRQSSIS